jgi:hypothetical protein
VAHACLNAANCDACAGTDAMQDQPASSSRS